MIKMRSLTRPISRFYVEGYVSHHLKHQVEQRGQETPLTEYQSKEQIWKVKKTQHERVLEVLKVKDLTTFDIIGMYILSPQKVIEKLRHLGYDIKTIPVEGQKYSRYHLVKGEPVQQVLFKDIKIF